jgi:hypothetical protein
MPSGSTWIFTLRRSRKVPPPPWTGTPLTAAASHYKAYRQAMVREHASRLIYRSERSALSVMSCLSGLSGITLSSLLSEAQFPPPTPPPSRPHTHNQSFLLQCLGNLGPKADCIQCFGVQFLCVANTDEAYFASPKNWHPFMFSVIIAKSHQELNA